MKRLLSLILSAVMAVSLTTAVTAEETLPPPTVYAGMDVALEILRECVKLSNNATVETHDYNENDKIDMGDALLVLRGIVGLGEKMIVVTVDDVEPPIRLDPQPCCEPNCTLKHNCDCDAHVNPDLAKCGTPDCVFRHIVPCYDPDLNKCGTPDCKLDHFVPCWTATNPPIKEVCNWCGNDPKICNYGWFCVSCTDFCNICGEHVTSCPTRGNCVPVVDPDLLKCGTPECVLIHEMPCWTLDEEKLCGTPYCVFKHVVPCWTPVSPPIGDDWFVTRNTKYFNEGLNVLKSYDELESVLSNYICDCLCETSMTASKLTQLYDKAFFANNYLVVWETHGSGSNRYTVTNVSADGMITVKTNVGLTLNDAFYSVYVTLPNTFSPESLNVNEVRLLPDYVVPQPAKDVPFQLAIYGGKRTPYNDNDDRDDVRVMTSPEELNALLAINDGPPGTTILTPEEIKSGEYAAVEINIALGSGGYVPIIDSLTVNGDTLTANVAVWDNCRELGFTCDMKYWNITLLVKSAYIKGITKYETTRESVNFCTIGTKYEPLFDIGFYETCVNDCIAAMTAWRGEWSKRVSEPITPQPEPQPQMRPLSCATHDCGACHACHSWCNDEQCKICGFAAIRKAFQLNVLNLMGEIGDFPMKHIETQNGNHAFLVGYGLTDGAPTLRVGYYSYWLGSSDLGIYVYTNDGAILPLNDAYENGYLADHELFNIISPWLWTEAHY